MLEFVLDNAETVGSYATHSCYRFGGSLGLATTPEPWQRQKGADNKYLLRYCEDYEYERDVELATSSIAHATDEAVYTPNRIWLLQQLGHIDRAFHVLQQMAIDYKKSCGGARMDLRD